MTANQAHHKAAFGVLTRNDNMTVVQLIENGANESNRVSNTVMMIKDCVRNEIEWG